LRCSGLVIDNVLQVVDKLSTQNELLYLIDQRSLRNRPLIFTLDRDPVRSDGLLPQLTSRLSGGLCLPVHPPGRDALKTILLDMAQFHHLTLTENALLLLLDRLQVTVPKILHFFSQLKTAVRAELLESKLLDNASIRSLPVIDATFITRLFYRSEADRLKLARLIIKHVAAEFNLKPTDVRSNSRKQSFVMARGISIWLIRKLLDLSFAKIGSLFGNRDHSTIMHAFRKTDNQLQPSDDSSTNESKATHSQLRHTVNRLELKLSNLFASEIQFV
jgi:chromosomal replication initiator protein